MEPAGDYYSSVHNSELHSKFIQPPPSIPLPRGVTVYTQISESPLASLEGGNWI
jgi:hypothetical protein